MHSQVALVDDAVFHFRQLRSLVFMEDQNDSIIALSKP